MLDAFIIDRIRRQPEQRDGALVPLHIEVPRPPPEPEPRRSELDREERGITEIDFSI